MSSLTRSPHLRTTLSSLFQAVQEGLGVSVVPSHFYFPVPSLKALQEKNWSACSPCPRIDFRLDEQVQRLRIELLPFAREWEFPEESNGDSSEFHVNNGFFERVDAEVAHSFVRRYKPGRIVEIGSGNSTLLLAAALRRNIAEGFDGELISIEPAPPRFLKGGVPGLTRLIEARVQAVPLDLFRSLEANDILFIDSSHVVSTDSDVVHEYLRILPELAPGVLVHFHDIFTPLDYPRKFVVTNLCFWSEQYLLEAFLSFNSAYRVLWSASAMQKFHRDVLLDAFPRWAGSFARMQRGLKAFVPTLDGNNVWPCSFWMVRS